MKQYNPIMKGRADASIEAGRIDRYKIGKERRLFNAGAKFFHRKAAVCTRCKRGMSQHTARQQVENKMENAPICIPCIMGTPRKELAY